MRTPRPNQLHDELDALLDGRPVQLTPELVPLAEAAAALRAELAGFQLDPEVVDRHLERVLDGSATVVHMPTRSQPSGWEVRRRVAAVVLAAALVLAPATIASAAALPGQPIYPLKLAIEQLRVVSVQWSPSAEAVERTRIADERREELVRLVDLRLFNRVGPALHALEKAVMAAQIAVREAARQGGPDVTKLEGQLKAVEHQASVAFGKVQAALQDAPPLDLTNSTKEKLKQAVEDSRDVLASPGSDVPAPAPEKPPATSPPTGEQPAPSVSTPTAPPSSEAPPSSDPSTSTTSPPPSSTEASTTTTIPADPETGEGQGGGESADRSAAGRSQGGPPPTTAGEP